MLLTNDLGWAASTVTGLYRARWQVEMFFKQLKQTLKLSDLISYSANGDTVADLDGATGAHADALLGMAEPMDA